MINGYAVIIPENLDTELKQFVQKLFGRQQYLNIHYFKDELKGKFGCNPIEILSSEFVGRFGRENIASAYKSRIYEVEDDLVYKVQN